MLENKRILVLGGTGLIGEEVVNLLAGKNKVTVVSLGTLKDKETFKRIVKKHPGVKHITGNVFLPTAYKDKTFNELLESEDFLDQYLELLYAPEKYVDFFIYEAIKKAKPDIVVDAINSATVLSYTKNISFLRNFLKGDILKQKAFLATLSMPRLISFFNCIYQTLKETKTTDIFLKVGTTGTGGMGFNIPYTHGETKPSFSLLEKAAVSGAYTSLLYVLSKTFGVPQVKEVKPAALVGYKKIGEGTVTLGREGSILKILDYEEIQRIKLIDGLEMKFLENKGGKEFQSVFIDTGENGQFALEEFRSISNPRQMGFVTKEEIASVVLRELENKTTGKEVISSLSQAVMGPSLEGEKQRKEAIRVMEQTASGKKLSSLAFEVLGPPRLSKLIFEAYLFLKYQNFVGLTEEDITMVISTGIPVLLESNELLVGRKPKIPETPANITEENINKWSEAGWVDLRKSNHSKWEKRFQRLKRSNKSQKIGDVVAWIFEEEDRGFRK